MQTTSTIKNPFFTPDWLLSQEFGALCTTRKGGVSAYPFDDGHGFGGLNLGDHVGDEVGCVTQNRNLLMHHLPNEPIWLNQVHGTDVLELNHAHLSKTDSFINKPIADAVCTNQPNQVCAILTADCLPILFCDSKAKVVGAAHAGWRGLAAGIIENTVTTLQKLGAHTSNISVWLGPAISALQFEVGAEVRDNFLQQSCEYSDVVSHAFKKISVPNGATTQTKYLADIYLLAKILLHRLGITQISGGEFCTVSQKSKFFSYRRDGVTGRIASLIWIR